MSKSMLPLWSRPLRAAELFVSECIIEIKGDTKDDLWEKPWFADIYSWAKEWYEARFGEAMTQSSDDRKRALVILFGTPFKVNVPLSVTEPDKPGETVWVSIPAAVRPREDVLGWLDKSPNVEDLSEEETDDFKQRISSVGTLVRTIHVNLISAEYSADPMHGLSGSILSHLEKAVDDIISYEPENVSVAFWEMHLANEKALKLYLRQREVPTPRTHDLEKLRKLAEEHEAPTDTEEFFRVLPTKDAAIGCRYGENSNIDLREAVGVYNATLNLVSIYARALKRRYVMDNARFLLQAPPWMKRRV